MFSSATGSLKDQSQLSLTVRLDYICDHTALLLILEHQEVRDSHLLSPSGSLGHSQPVHHSHPSPSEPSRLRLLSLSHYCIPSGRYPSNGSCQGPRVTLFRRRQPLVVRIACPVCICNATPPVSFSCNIPQYKLLPASQNLTLEKSDVNRAMIESLKEELHTHRRWRRFGTIYEGCEDQKGIEL